MKTVFYIKKAALLIFSVVMFAACQENTLIEKIEINPPSITDFSPKSGEIGTEITIIGENLQRVDHVLIGGGVAEVKYRISDTKLIAKVLSTSRNGKITVQNVKGESSSNDAFTITYVTPSIATYPVSGTVNEEIVITGTNLNVIDSVMLGDLKAVIISQRDNEIVFKVPFSDEELPVALRFNYFDGTQNSQLGPDGETFIILKEAPTITDVPTTLTKYTPITILGERLTLIDSIFVGDIKVRFISKTDTEIKIDMPTNYFGGNMNGVLKGIYYGVRQVIIADMLSIVADPNEPRYYSWNDVLLSARGGYGGTENAFFDAETGIIYHSCSAFENRLDIDFYLYDQSLYVQLYGPHNGTSTVKNYKCEGKSIDPQDGSWSDFYGAGGITTKFKVLSKDSANHLAVISAFEAGTIVEINDALFEGINEPGTSSPRVYKTFTSSGYNITQGHFSIDKNNIGWVKNYTTGKNGIIRITDMPKDAVNGRIPELKFDIIWSK